MVPVVVVMENAWCLSGRLICNYIICFNINIQNCNYQPIHSQRYMWIQYATSSSYKYPCVFYDRRRGEVMWCLGLKLLLYIIWLLIKDVSHRTYKLYIYTTLTDRGKLFFTHLLSNDNQRLLSANFSYTGTRIYVIY